MRLFRKGIVFLPLRWLVTTLLLASWIWITDTNAATKHTASTKNSTTVHKIVKTTPKVVKTNKNIKINKVVKTESIKTVNKVVAKKKVQTSKVTPPINKAKMMIAKEKKSHATHATRHVSHRHIAHARISQPPEPELPTSAPVTASHAPLRVNAAKAIVIHEGTGETLFAKNIDHVSPIASVTKLMTAMVVLDRNLLMDEEITIIDNDVDRVKHSSSRLQVGTVLTRREALQLALMSSENRAAAALARTYPGGVSAFVTAMNRKASDLGMNSSYFADSTGLNSSNVSTADDLARMARAARRYEVIHDMTTTSSYELGVGTKKRPTLFINTNRLVRGGNWDIGLSKTGYINEAGHCLVMEARINEVPTIMVFLGNFGKYSCQADAVRVRQWFLQRQSSE
ncbi:serine-type D-Ala-D-Ala endopeptidase (penicillin-binding protein 7) [Gammaproteobacteria bacterium]